MNVCFIKSVIIQLRKEDIERIIHSTEMNSEIVTTSIHPIPSNSLFQQNPVHITFHHKNFVCGKIMRNHQRYLNVQKCQQLQNKWENTSGEVEEKSVCVFWQSDTKFVESFLLNNFANEEIILKIF